mgnify:CR=1 FL=1
MNEMEYLKKKLKNAQDELAENGDFAKIASDNFIIIMRQKNEIKALTKELDEANKNTQDMILERDSLLLEASVLQAELEKTKNTRAFRKPKTVTKEIC